MYAYLCFKIKLRLVVAKKSYDCINCITKRLRAVSFNTHSYNSTYLFEIQTFHETKGNSEQKFYNSL